MNDTALLIVPTVTIYEVFKVILRESSENEALQAAAAMRKGTVVDLTDSLAIASSKLSLEHNLPMADSIILATAKEFDATIWTQGSIVSPIKSYSVVSVIKTSRISPTSALPLVT